MIGTKVKLTKSMAKWYLDHPDAFYAGPGRVDTSYETLMKMSLLVLIGGEVIGTVVSHGSMKNTYGVDFKSPVGQDFAYYEYPANITKVQ